VTAISVRDPSGAEGIFDAKFGLEVFSAQASRRSRSAVRADGATFAAAGGAACV